MKKDKLWYRSRGIDRMEERFGNPIQKFIKQRLKTNKTVRVLELGFGEGKCLLELRNKFPNLELHGINNKKQGNMYKTQDFLKNAKKFKIDIKKTNLPKPHFYDAGIKLKFKSNFFDLIISQVAFHYIGNKAKTIEELWRVLKKDGKAFIHFDRLQSINLPDFMKNTKTPLFIIYQNNKFIPTKTYFNKIAKQGFNIRLSQSLPGKKQFNLLMTKNTTKSLKLNLEFDGNSTLYLTPLNKSDPYKIKNTGIWWGTRSVFNVK
tara:strand:+ start:3797 stop:4582 length:786 start_codon:yes stop_codon:yes gene_type:complete